MSVKKLAIEQKLIVSSLLVAVLVVIDQAFKALAAKNLKNHPGYSFLWDTIRLEYAENSGAFLSLGASLDSGTRTILFEVGVVIIIGFCVLWLIRSAHNWLSVISLALVISGGIGNLIDRVSRDSVIDFIYMGIGPIHTGVFNVADIAITAGLLLMLYEQYFVGKDEKE